MNLPNYSKLFYISPKTKLDKTVFFISKKGGKTKFPTYKSNFPLFFNF